MRKWTPEPRALGRGVVRTVAASATVLSLGVSALALATDGFAAFTYDGARALRALRAPAGAPPDLALVTHEGRALRLADFGAPVLLVNFVYTQCVSVCRASGDLFGRLQGLLAQDLARGQMHLLTVSLDPERDTPPALARYRSRYGRAGAGGWTLGVPPDRSELARWLDAFGVIVVPRPDGELEHNAAVAVVGPQRRIRAFVSLERADELAEWVRRIAAPENARDA